MVEERALSLSQVKEADYSGLHAILSPLLPQSLTLLGPIEQHRDGTFDMPIWTSFTPNEAPPALFALFTIAGYQSRFFCSADACDEQPTREEELFLASFLQSAVQAAYTYLANTRGLADVSPEIGLIVGSIHGKWEKCLRTLPFFRTSLPVQKILLPPSAAQTFAEGAKDERLPPDARVTTLGK